MDFKQIIEDLRVHKVNQSQILRMLRKQELKCSQATISKIARGEICDPRYSIASAIINIHHNSCADIR